MTVAESQFSGSSCSDNIYIKRASSVYIEGFLSNHKDEINRNFLRLRMSTIDQKGKGNPISTQITTKSKGSIQH